ncbi:MAG: hypothetical protein KIS79_17620, partial [Burkholderiales bacterium]|nr:hypothetical protein [Burkholderiales bacterium]
MNVIYRMNVLQEAERLAQDGELGNSDAIRLLQLPHTGDEIRALLCRFEHQLSREARAKLIREVYAPLPANVDNQRFEPLFDRYPISGRTYTTANGTVVLNEIQYYNGEMVHLYGECADVAQITQELAGTGLKPFLLTHGTGQQTAVLQVWANRLTDTSLRPYNSMFIVIPAVPTDVRGGWAFSADDNGASSVLSMLHGAHDASRRIYANQARLYFVRLYDSTQVAIDVGRERMGTDKRPGDVRLRRDGRLLDLSMTDGYGRTMLRGGLRLVEDGQAYLPALAKAASTAGIALDRMSPGTEYVFPAVARIGRRPALEWQWRTDVVPCYQPLTGGEVNFDASTEEGAMLVRWGFEPKVLGYIPNVRGVITGLPEPAATDALADRAWRTAPAATIQVERA